MNIETQREWEISEISELRIFGTQYDLETPKDHYRINVCHKKQKNLKKLGTSVKVG